jgi:hypothetical protein
MDGHLGGVAFERAAAFVLGLAAASATLFGGAPPYRPPDVVAIQSAPSDGIQRTSSFDPAPPIAPEVWEPGRGATPPSFVDASVALAGRDEGAAAPSGVAAYVEARSPGGRTVMWYEHDLNCGGQGRTLLPRTGPVTAVC